MTPEHLLNYFKAVRQQTARICQPLATEDYIPQPITDVSPPKWHLAHTTWFFETFILKPYLSHYRDYHPQFNYLFNSYYNNVGNQWVKSERGALSRPTVQEVYNFRKSVDEQMETAINQVKDRDWEEFQFLVILGCNHEQQHQELLLTDIKYIFATNPTLPSYLTNVPWNPGKIDNPNYKEPHFINIEGGLYDIGYEGNDFHMDNERPVHKVHLKDFKIQDRLVTNGEFREFVESGGYEDFRNWLDDGWAEVSTGQWNKPLYWQKMNGEWYEMTLAGLQKLKLDAPVTHVNFYEAEAYAEWAGKRLPTEFEWEVAAKTTCPDAGEGNFVNDGFYQPQPAPQNGSENLLSQIYGDVWEWTYSAYLPYPGYKPAPGALGEYNGKFMINQMVLRGGSCATPRDHFRISYRNFFPPNTQFQFSGFRLAEDR